VNDNTLIAIFMVCFTVAFCVLVWAAVRTNDRKGK
jgi:hypothetical protein